MNIVNMNDVSEAEFYHFIHSYPKKLDSRTVTMGEPPSIIYYEFGNKNKVVARVKMGNPTEYEIIE